MSHLVLASLVLLSLQQPAAISAVPSVQSRPQAIRPVETVVPNDNRQAAGSRRNGVLRLGLVARVATWRPSANVDSTVTVMAFAEEGGQARIPGPLVRATAGTELRVSVRNALPDSTLVVHGLRAGTVADDTIQIAPGAVREVAFTAGAAGTYLYWGTTTSSPVDDRPWRDSQLTGALVIDPAGVAPDTAERIFVITVLDLYPEDTLRNKAKENVWERAINGRSWPVTERLQYAVGDTVRWRWLNGSSAPHPMHLHGFHFRVLSKGERNSDTAYAVGAERMVVTEFMAPGTTFRMDWVPTRAGAWLMHCHMIPHIVPFPERPQSARGHDLQDVEKHPLDGMAGLVIGVNVVERAESVQERSSAPARHLRVLVQQAHADSGRPTTRGYVLQGGAEPVADSVEVPGSPLVLTRGETTAITVVNRLDEPTTVHWHGMELESVFDGVSGWSRTRGRVAPLLAPGDSFTVVITPPRAGTFMYHTHMDEGQQLGTGLYGPLIVLEPGERWDPATDLVFMFGSALHRDTVHISLNGHPEPAPMELRAGTRYRIRLINIHAAAPATIELTADSAHLTWRALAKDGADLPAAMQVESPARLVRFGVGEAYDFAWTPASGVDAVLSARLEGRLLRQMLLVR